MDKFNTLLVCWMIIAMVTWIFMIICNDMRKSRIITRFMQVIIVVGFIYNWDIFAANIFSIAFGVVLFVLFDRLASSMKS